MNIQINIKDIVDTIRTSWKFVKPCFIDTISNFGKINLVENSSILMVKTTTLLLTLQKN